MMFWIPNDINSQKDDSLQFMNKTLMCVSMAHGPTKQLEQQNNTRTLASHELKIGALTSQK